MRQHSQIYSTRCFQHLARIQKELPVGAVQSSVITFYFIKKCFWCQKTKKKKEEKKFFFSEFLSSGLFV